MFIGSFCANVISVLQTSGPSGRLFESGTAMERRCVSSIAESTSVGGRDILFVMGVWARNFVIQEVCRNDCNSF